MNREIYENKYDVERCRWAIRIKYLRVTGVKRIALASFPRSGNTWVRFMIEKATGEKTGSKYQDRILPRSGHGIVIKTHDLDSYRYTDAVHLIRNPFDAIESYYYFKRDVSGDKDLDWDEHVRYSVLKWYYHTEHWSQSKCSLYRIRYEDLCNDGVRQLRALLSWLGYDLSTDRLLEVINESGLDKMREGHPKYGSRFFRRGEIGRGIKHFNIKQRQLASEVLGEYMKLFDYEEGL
jgi:hypothetical protein